MSQDKKLSRRLKLEVKIFYFTWTYVYVMVQFLQTLLRTAMVPLCWAEAGVFFFVMKLQIVPNYDDLANLKRNWIVKDKVLKIIPQGFF